MGNPVYRDKEKKMSFLRQVIRRSHLNALNRSAHPLRTLLEEPLEDIESRSLMDSVGIDDLETILLDNINPGIINMSVQPEESLEETRLRELDFQDLFQNSQEFRRHSTSSFYRWQSLRGTRPMRSSYVTVSRIPRASFANIFRARPSNSTSFNDISETDQT